MTLNITPHNPGATVPLFFLEANSYVYSSPVSDPKGRSCYFPLEVDTEYKILDSDLNYPHQKIVDILTVQIKGVEQDKGRIYAHANTISNKRHKIFETGFAPIQYLRDLGYDASITRNDTVDILSVLPVIQIDLYAYFALVDINKIAVNGYRDDLVKLALNYTADGIKMERRLRTTTKKKGKVLDYCYLPWCITINKVKYAVRLSCKDTGAVHGNSNYASFCKNSGIELPYKDLFDSEEKSRMDEMNILRPVDFDNYALGDLFNHKALISNSEKFFRLYKSLNKEKGFTIPKLTTGSTITSLVQVIVNSFCGHKPMNNKDLINAFCKPASVEGLEHLKTRTSGLCLKVDGGRCRNNRPTEIVVEGALCDLDIAGAYTESMREQIYPIGIPVIIGYDPKSKHNNYQTLRQFIKYYSDELIPGLWMARVSLKEGYKLKNPQDFFASWKPPKNLYDLITDTNNQENDEWWDNVDNIGITKVLTHEISNASLTHDGLQWLEHICTTRQRKELLDNLVVNSVIYYPKSDRINCMDAMQKAHKEWKGANTTTVRKVRGKTTKIIVQQECHKWVGMPLGDEVIDLLARERKKSDKGTPENTLYKLAINTIYGVMVSPFFAISNVVVGNNITGRVRALAWYMEKGLNGFQSITDGCCFDMNRIIAPISNGTNQRSLSPSLLIDIPEMVNKGRGSYTSLSSIDGYDKVYVRSDNSISLVRDNETVNLSREDSLKWVNKFSMTHLQNLFPTVDVLHKETTDIYGNQRAGLFEFEAKGFYRKGTYHGSANYMLENGNDKHVKFRSYPKKPVKQIVYKKVDDVKLLDCINRNYYPAKVFLESLSNPNNIGRSDAFLQEQILKVNEWRKHYDKWQRSQVVWGDTIEKVRLLKEFSLSQFTFQSFEQYLAWEREYNRLMRRYGQSYEMFFLNADMSLDYQKMILDINSKVRRGDMGFFEGVDKRASNLYRTYSEHPARECVEALKKYLLYRYKLTSATLPYMENTNMVSDPESLVSEY